MEERMIDDEEARGIKLKRTQSGETDAVEEGTDEQEEYVFDVPEEEYDESLVGLTPSQLEQVLEERKKAEEEARLEFESHIVAGEAALEKGLYEEAEEFFAKADRYVFVDERVPNGLWVSRTRAFTVKEPFYDLKKAEAFAACPADLKERAREAFGAEFEKEREEARAEERMLAPRVEAKRAEREEAFAGNRKYYLVRFCAALAVLALMMIGTALSASFIVRTKSIAPVVLTGVFGALALAAVIALLVFFRQLYLALRLCAQNTVEEATEDGARLKALREKIRCLSCVLDD